MRHRRPCRCWRCRSRGGVRAVAPRLALAHDQRRELSAQARIVRMELLNAERLVAHRELQLIRAGWVGDPRYLDRRENKLARAKQALESCRAKLARLEDAA